MSFSYIDLHEVTVSCGYISGKEFTSEHYIISSMDNSDLDSLLENGYRHFGCYFFRPICSGCNRCIPIRIPLERYSFSRSARRLFNKNRSFRIVFSEPHYSRETFELYRHHKKRFGEFYSENFDQYVESFHYPFSFNYQLSIFDQDALIAVAHMDITEKSLSAVYCYYDDRYYHYSLGAFAIYKEIEIALQYDLEYMYLGYYIADNSHMNYKVRYYPNQLLVGSGEWRDYIGPDKTVVNKDLVDIGFSPENAHCKGPSIQLSR